MVSSTKNYINNPDIHRREGERTEGMEGADAWRGFINISAFLFWFLMAYGTYAVYKMHRRTGGRGFTNILSNVRKERQDGNKKDA